LFFVFHGRHRATDLFFLFFAQILKGFFFHFAEEMGKLVQCLVFFQVEIMVIFAFFFFFEVSILEILPIQVTWPTKFQKKMGDERSLEFKIP